MSSPLELPARPHLHWLKNRAKERLEELRRADPTTQLADAQLDIARAYGFPSWRALKARIDALRAAPQPETGSTPASNAESERPEALHDRIMKAFFHAVGTGRIEEVRQALDAAPAMVNAVGPHPFWGGRPQALHVSIESNRREVFELLLERGADLNGANDRYLHWSPLLLAARPGREAYASALLARGARVGLLEALALGDDARLDAILDAEGDAIVRSPPPHDGTLLHFARTPHAVDRLLALGVPAGGKDYWGASVIEALSRRGPAGAPLVARLVAHGVTAGAAELARLGDRAALERLLERDPAAVRATATFKAAVDFSHHDLVRWLIASGCDVNGRAKEQSEQTPLHSAAWNGDLEMVRLLVEAGADVDARDRQYDGVPLGWAETAIEVTNNPRCAEVVDYLRPLTGSRGGGVGVGLAGSRRGMRWAT